MNQKKECNISIVVPLYNEEMIVEKNTLILMKFLEKEFISFEIILANDGSTDSTLEKIKNLHKTYDNIKIVTHFPNKGRGSILNKAFKIAEGKIIGYIDADLEISPLYILECKKMIDKGFDIAIVSKNTKYSRVSRPLSRKIASKCFAFLTRILLKSKIKDHQGGLKLFRKQVLLSLLPSIESNGWAWDTEIIVKAQWLGFNVAEIPLDIVFKRKTKVKLFSDTLKMSRVLIKLLFERIKYN
ncbi:MAG: glycosyltransferase family 2 protein [Candidatus Helarchaeota archaeon]